MDMLSTIFVSIVSAILGFFISAWSNRLLPWVAILEFAELQRGKDKVKIDKALQITSRNSWATNELEEDENTLSSISDCLANTKAWLRNNAKTETMLHESIQQIVNSKSDNETILYLVELLRDAAISNLIAVALLREKLSSNYADSVEEKIKYYVNEKQDNGCFLIVFPGHNLKFGGNFNDFPHYRDLLLPFVKTISSLNKQCIVEILEKLVPIFKEQKDLHKLLADEAQKINDDNMRWQCEFIITNFGATPFILFPESPLLCIVGKHIKDFKINSVLLYKNEDDEKKGTWSSSMGFSVIQPGETQKLALVTDIQKNIEGSSVLKGVFKSGECKGYIKLRMIGREMPWKMWVKSAQLPFRGIQE